MFDPHSNVLEITDTLVMGALVTKQLMFNQAESVDGSFT